MILKKPVLVLLVALLVATLTGNSWADVSNAAVLFLRIAAGARAAGMGEAFVAVADDATTTHWNPAGLGAYPLSDTWIESSIPWEHRPIKAIASLKTGGQDNFLGYELWAISPHGLLRYDNRRWHDGDVFSTRSDETLRQKVAGYFTLLSDERLDAITERVAIANNSRSIDYVNELIEKIRRDAPTDYSRYSDLEAGLDSLPGLFWQCRLNWDRVLEAESQYERAMRDSVWTETESDRVSIALGRAQNRFLPEDITIPFGSLIDGEPVAIASHENTVFVGSTDGLVQFNGNRWQVITTEDGLPSNNILCMKQTDAGVLLGTDNGLVMWDGIQVDTLEARNPLPNGAVTAIGSAGLHKIFVVVDGDLYYFNGETWANYLTYTVTLDETMESLAEHFSVYGTASDKVAYIERLKELNPRLAADGASLNAGDEILAPFATHFRGAVNDIYVGAGMRIWLGTDYGIIQFDGSTWSLLGYREHTVAEGETLESLLMLKNHASQDAYDEYEVAIRSINDIEYGDPEVGSTIKLYKDPRSSKVNQINAWEFRIYFATASGLIETDGKAWGRADLKGLGDQSTLGLHTAGSEVWFVTADKIVVKARGRSEFNMMHAQWLPELSDDLHYGFLSFTSGVEGWGTFGGNVTLLYYGSFNRTGESSSEIIGTFDSYDVAFTGSFGTSITSKLKGGISAKLIYSRLAEQGAGVEVGQGTSTGVAVDLGLLYQMSPRLNLGLALTNLGTRMAYIDAAQSDELPRNLAVGFAYRLINSEYNYLLITAEANKILVGVNDGLSTELKETIFNIGAEFSYMNLLAARAGYIYDEEGKVKVPTVGLGLTPIDWVKFDFAYIPSSDNSVLSNTLRVSLTMRP